MQLIPPVAGRYPVEALTCTCHVRLRDIIHEYGMGAEWEYRMGEEWEYGMGADPLPYKIHTQGRLCDGLVGVQTSILHKV